MPAVADTAYGTVLRIAAASAISLAALSCSGPRTTPVDPSTARDALHRTLESWKNGEPIEAIQSRSPKIVAQDMDWTAGFKLVDYEVIGDGTSRNTQLRCPVRLSLLDPTGKETNKDVAYVISTTPLITVFREIAM